MSVLESDHSNTKTLFTVPLALLGFLPLKEGNYERTENE